MLIKNILVTGAAGFIASHLIERLLDEGYSVVGIDNFDPFYSRELKEKNLAVFKLKGGNRFAFYELDIRDKKRLFEVSERFDAVIHIAAKAGVRPSIDNPQDYISNNISGTQNILDLMVERKCNKLLFASSSSVYGNNEKVPFSETDAVDNPISPYAFTKKANELQIHAYHKLYNIDAICLRFFTVFGPRQRPDLAIRKFIQLIQQDKPVEMFGDGSTSRDYTYVSDTVDGICKALNYIENKTSVYEIINLGNSNPVSLKEMVDVIYSEMNKQPNIIQLPMQPGDVETTYADISKAKSMLNYAPKVSFRDGVKSLIEWLNNS